METQRLVFAVPRSELELQLATLAKERALYWLVLGMPDQADLLELIAARESWDEETIRKACLELSAMSGCRHSRQPRQITLVEDQRRTGSRITESAG
jgi:hypothetical protein